MIKFAGFADDIASDFIVLITGTESYSIIRILALERTEKIKEDDENGAFDNFSENNDRTDYNPSFQSEVDLARSNPVNQRMGTIDNMNIELGPGRAKRESMQKVITSSKWAVNNRSVIEFDQV